MDKAQIVSWLNQNGWIMDSYGNFKKERDGKRYRMKMQKNSLRYETWVDYTPSEYDNTVKGAWIRLRSAYYKDLSLTADSKLSGLKR